MKQLQHKETSEKELFEWSSASLSKTGLLFLEWARLLFTGKGRLHNPFSVHNRPLCSTSELPFITDSASTHKKDTICEITRKGVPRGCSQTWVASEALGECVWKTRNLGSTHRQPCWLVNILSSTLVHNCLKKYLKVGHRNVVRSHSDVDKHWPLSQGESCILFLLLWKQYWQRTRIREGGPLTWFSG